MYRAGAVSTSGRGLTSGKMVFEFDSHDWRGRKLQEWLLLLLRFAVTREPTDRSAALAMADELDSLGMQWRPAAPSFFLRTSNEVCAAIVSSRDKHSKAVLRRHVARIHDSRMKRVFEAAIEHPLAAEHRRGSARGKARTDQDLWKGLRKK
jgi:hypothetical protein